MTRQERYADIMATRNEKDLEEKIKKLSETDKNILIKSLLKVVINRTSRIEI